MKRFALPVLGVLLAGLLAGFFVSGHPAAATSPPSRYFPETKHTVGGEFLDYWERHGGLAQQGYPLTEQMDGISETDGKHYVMQYFERAVFELHPENAGTPYSVQLSLLGSFEYKHRYGTAGAPRQRASTDNPRFFRETGHVLGGKFRAYWESHGGLAQQGYPISDEFTETSALDGKFYVVQYFQRAVFELHLENAGTPYEVLLSQLGTFRYRSRVAPLPIPSPQPGHFQMNAAGSDSYLVWEDHISGTNDSRVSGLNLQTQQTFDVRSFASTQLNPAVSGPFVVWEERACTTTSCRPGIITIEDLVTTFPLQLSTDNSGDNRQPTISGRNIAWIDTDSQFHTKLFYRNLDTAPETVVEDLRPSVLMDHPILSDEYLVWAEMLPHAQPGAAVAVIKAYSIKDGSTRAVSWLNNWPVTYTLADHRLFWQDGPADETHELDLVTNAPALLPRPAAVGSVRGDIMVWAMPGPRPGDDSTIWGIDLRVGQPLPLVTSPGVKGSPVIADDWLVWLDQSGHYVGSNLSELFLEASAPHFTETPVPTATPVPVPTGGPDIRLHALNVVGQPVTAKNYVFYISSPPEGARTPGPPRIDIYASDIGSRETFLVKTVAGNADFLASDGNTLVWEESDNRGFEGIEGFDLNSRTSFEILPPAQRELGGVAVAGSMVYYHDGSAGHIGLYAVNADTHVETLVSGRGKQPVADGGALLWNEEQDLGTPGPGGSSGPAICTLHLRDSDNTDTTIATVDGPLSGDCSFSGYHASGSLVVWSANPPAPDMSVHLYRRGTGATSALPTGWAVNPLINGATVLWTQPPTTIQNGWTIHSLNLNTSAQRVEVGPITEIAEAWGLLNAGAYPFTIESEPPTGRRELYVLGLGSPPGP
ncbi:MAG: hypothetical protein ACR2M0_09670 [Chloroflexia bacterium]